VTRGRGSASPPGSVLTRAARALLPVESWNSDTSQGEKFIIPSETSGYPETSPCSDIPGGPAIDEEEDDDDECRPPPARSNRQEGLLARQEPEIEQMPAASADIYRTQSNSSSGSKLWIGRSGSDEFGGF